jgi:hypothetical protein
MGKTDMQISVIGFGGAEIGFESAAPQTVKPLLQDALDEWPGSFGVAFASAVC